MLPLRTGRQYGKAFENSVAHQAAMCGMLLVFHGLQARFIGAKKVIAVKSDVDCRIVHQGQVAFFDAKSRAGNTLPLSTLDPAQQQLLARYGAAGCRSGFLAELRGCNQVVWFSHSVLAKASPGRGLRPEDGVLLGTTQAFALPLIFGTPH